MAQEAQVEVLHLRVVPHAVHEATSLLEAQVHAVVVTEAQEAVLQEVLAIAVRGALQEALVIEAVRLLEVADQAVHSEVPVAREVLAVTEVPVAAVVALQAEEAEVAVAVADVHNVQINSI